MDAKKLKEIRKALGKSQFDFAEMLGVSSRTLQYWEKGQAIPYAKVVLLEKLEKGITKEVANDTQKDTTYLVPYYANAGRSVGALDGISLHDMEQVVSPVSGAEYCISIYGDSMQPTYPSGCRVFVKKVQNPIVPGNTYVIDTADGLMLKRLTYSDNPANLLCVSINPDKVLYKPFEYAKKDIMGIYRVMGVFIPVNE